MALTPIRELQIQTSDSRYFECSWLILVQLELENFRLKYFQHTEEVSLLSRQSRPSFWYITLAFLLASVDLLTRGNLSCY